MPKNPAAYWHIMKEAHEASRGSVTDLTREEKLAVKEHLAAIGLPLDVAVTFDDVYVPEEYSEVRSRSEIWDFSAHLTNTFKLNIPIVSANMETVTGIEMAVAMGREGGLGFLPQTLPIGDRLEMLERIRRTDCAFIDKPLTIRPDATLKQAKRLMEKFKVNSLILVDEKRRPAGILTNRDWSFEKNDEKPVSKLAGALHKNLITGSKHIAFDAAAELLVKNKIEKLPLIDDGGKLCGLITAHGLFYHLYYPLATRDVKGRFVMSGSIGVGKNFTKEHMSEVEQQVKRGIKILLIDTARAFSVNAEEAVRAIKKNFPELILVAGNVSSARGAKALFEWGADVVKVNQGRGHVCRTSKTGVGQPQLSAIAETSVIARLLGKRVIADGGMKNPGDFTKAIIAGADCLMTGYLLIGTNESAAEPKLNRDGFPVKTYEGSASLEAQRRRIKQGTLDRVREPEGVAEEVPITGSLSDKVKSLLDGMRSAMSYHGVKSLDELREKGSFKLQSHAGLIEGTKKK